MQDILPGCSCAPVTTIFAGLCQFSSNIIQGGVQFRHHAQRLQRLPALGVLARPPAILPVTPVAEQRILAERIRGHWQDGWGASYNPKRREALESLRVVPELDTALSDLEENWQRPAKIVVTGAQDRPGSISCKGLRQLFEDTGQPLLLLFGTGWGLTEELFARADFVLEPIKGTGEYNHLSVRSAAAIILDRLLGER